MADEQRSEPADSVTSAPADAGAATPADAGAATPADAPGTFVPAPVPPAAPEDTGYTESGVPTFDSVREKIETRFGTAIGAHELAAETPEGRTAEERYEQRQKAAAERLQEIRDSMRAEPHAEPGPA